MFRRFSRVVLGCACSASILLVGCAHPMQWRVAAYMQENPVYAELPRGPARVDALWNRAKAMTGSPEEALRLLGSFAIEEGLKLKHPYSTGLTHDGPLSPNDKSGHFFAHAMWRYDDLHRFIHVAGLNSVAWETVGEVRSWFGRGKGFNWRDVWANRVGWEFGERLFNADEQERARILPSEVIAHADMQRPPQAQARMTQSGTESRKRHASL